MSWGVEDLGAAMGLPRVRDAEDRYLDIPRYARVDVRGRGGRAAGVEALDTVYTDIADLDGLRRECEEAVAMGFTGKISIHPSQIEVINEAFTPAPGESSPRRASWSRPSTSTPRAASSRSASRARWWTRRTSPAPARSSRAAA